MQVAGAHCRWDCERKKETLVLSQPFPGEKSVAPPCLAAGNATAVAEKFVGHRCRFRWLSGCRRTGSETVAVSVQPFLLRFGKRFNWKALLLLFRYLKLRVTEIVENASGAKLLAAVGFGLRRR
ncbi:uncharacterized protein LOC110266876 [Arachis ipaensis]|uniref:uncharacterized protein LOC110266876 n=1 Tax=Arachis ipaensis TaxID=130454 RepID=UPI000A2B6C49|nr:uncharacterized protein LOC110266876 [Arachis ipaensis]